MNDLPTLHIRNVPTKVIARLKRRAKANGRSLNAEVIEALEATAEEDRRREGLRKRLEELRAEYVLPEGASDAVEMIRRRREERAREIERRARGT